MCLRQSVVAPQPFVQCGAIRGHPRPSAAIIPAEEGGLELTVMQVHKVLEARRPLSIHVNGKLVWRRTDEHVVLIDDCWVERDVA
jgi:hypothetical protein